MKTGKEGYGEKNYNPFSGKQLTEGSFSVSENNLPVAKIRITFAPSLTYYTK